MFLIKFDVLLVSRVRIPLVPNGDRRHKFPALIIMGIEPHGTIIVP